MAKLIFITGGARSGKSRFAEKLAGEHDQVTYIATAQALDQEMRERIAKHQAQRPAHWVTKECPLRPQAAVALVGNGCILLDCLSVWVSNLLLQHWNEETEQLAAWAQVESTVSAQVQELLQAAADHAGTVLMVSNEVGSGLVPVYALGRAYRDLLGWVNQQVAAAADEVYWCVSGIPVLIKP